MTVKNVVKIGIAIAFLSIIAPISIPTGLISITLATFVIYIISSMYKPLEVLLIIVSYIIIGMIGLPVFSSFQGGFQVLLGHSGGFLIGYILMGLIISLLLKLTRKVYWYIIAMVVGTCICYLCGSLWFMFITESNLKDSLAVTVIPFILPDLIKIVLASILYQTIIKRFEIEKKIH